MRGDRLLKFRNFREEKLIYDDEKASYDLRKDGVCVPVVSSVKYA